MKKWGLKKNITNSSVESNEIKKFEFTKSGKFIVEVQGNFISINSKGILNAINKGLVGIKK